MFRVSHRGDDQSLLQFSTRDPIGWIDAEQFGRGVAAGTLRRDWTWLAFIDDDPTRAPVARAVWWGPVGSVHPVELRCLLVDPSVPHPELWGAALIRSAHRSFTEGGALFPPVVVLAVDGGLDGTWRQDAAAVAAVTWRSLAADDAGVATVIRPADAALTREDAPPQGWRVAPAATVPVAGSGRLA